MIQAYLDHGDTDTAAFELFVRSLPARRGFLLAAGLHQALDFLENLRFSSAEIEWLKSTGRFNNNLLEYLGEFRFTGEVHAMAEGTAFFVNEPILRVTAPLPQAQLVESRLINILHFQSLVAAKAARSVRAILDRGGLQEVTIFASGGLDEDELAACMKANAPIDGFGVGTSLTTSSDVPAIDFIYKLQEYAGVPRRKRSDKKATWPGRKQVWRRFDADGRMAGDRIALDRASSPAAATIADGAGEELLLHCVMRNGRR